MSGRILFFTLAVVTSFSATAQETFETLTVGAQVYSNVTVTTKTRTDVFISHSQGIASIKVKDLDDDAQIKLGYDVPKPVEAPKSKLSLPPALQIDSAKVREMEKELAEDAKAKLQEVKPVFVWVGIAILLLFHLIYSYLCKLLCLKTGYQPGFRIWLPVGRRAALLRAANMNKLWILTIFIPVLDIIRYIVWAWNITKARGKSGWTAAGLCVPGVNVIAFLYLALADSVPEDDQSNTKLVTFDPPARRTA